MTLVDAAQPALLIAGAEQAGKRVATAGARAALRGATLIQIENDSGRPVFIVSRWALTKELLSIEAVESWLDRLEGRRTPPGLADQAGT